MEASNTFDPCQKLTGTIDTFLNETRSSRDKKEYGIFTLPNGLETLLIKSTGEGGRNIASAAMTVQVGSFADEFRAEGLAHFCGI